MAVKRAIELPKGRYWVDAIGDRDIGRLTKWLDAQKGKNTIRVERTEHTSAKPGRPREEWILFRALRTVRWTGPGFPTVAKPGIKERRDTIQSPAGKSSWLDLADLPPLVTLASLWLGYQLLKRI